MRVRDENYEPGLRPRTWGAYISIVVQRIIVALSSLPIVSTCALYKCSHRQDQRIATHNQTDVPPKMPVNVLKRELSLNCESRGFTSLFHPRYKEH
jgi:hypothetical protein